MMMLKSVSAHFVRVLYLKMMMTFARQANETADSSSNLRERFREENKNLEFYEYSKVDLLWQTGNGEEENESYFTEEKKSRYKEDDCRYQVFLDRYIDLERCIGKKGGKSNILDLVDVLGFLMKMSQRKSVQELIEKMQTPRYIWLRDYGLWLKEAWLALWEYQQEGRKIGNEELGKEGESGKPMDTGDDTSANPKTSSTQKEKPQGNMWRIVNLTSSYQEAAENIDTRMYENIWEVIQYLMAVRDCLDDLRIPDLELIFSRFDVPFNLDLMIKLLAKLSLCSPGCYAREKCVRTNANKRLQKAYDIKSQIFFEQHTSEGRRMEFNNFYSNFKCSGEGGGDTACYHLDNVDVEVIVNGNSSFITASKICFDDSEIYTHSMDDFVCNCPKDDDICFCPYIHHYTRCECLAVVFTNFIDSLPASYISTKIRNYLECFFGDIGLSINVDANNIGGEIFGGPDNLLHISTGQKVSSSSDCVAEATKVSKNKEDNPCSSSAVFPYSLRFKTENDTMTGYIPRFRLSIKVFATDHDTSIFVPTDINRVYYSQCFLVLLKFLRKYSCKEFDINFNLVEESMVWKMKARFNEEGRCSVEFVEPIGGLCWLTELEGEILSTLFQYLKVEDLTVWVGEPQYKKNNKGAYYRALTRIFESCASTCKTLNLKVVYEVLSPELVAAICKSVNGFITCHYELKKDNSLLSNSVDESVLSEKKKLVDRFSLLKVEDLDSRVAINIKLKIGYDALDDSEKNKRAKDLINRKLLNDNMGGMNEYLKELKDIYSKLESLIERTSKIAEDIDGNIKVSKFVLEFPFWNDILVTLIKVRQSQNTFGEYASIFSGFGSIATKFKNSDSSVSKYYFRIEKVVIEKIRIEKVVIEKKNLADEEEWISIHFGATNESFEEREMQSSPDSGDTMDTTSLKHIYPIVLEVKNIPVVFTRHLLALGILIVREAKLRNTYCFVDTLTSPNEDSKEVWRVGNNSGNTSPNENSKEVRRVGNNSGNNIRDLLSRRIRLPKYLHHPGIFTPEEIKSFLKNALSPVYHYDFYCLKRIELEVYSYSKNEIDLKSYVPREFFLSEHTSSEKDKKDITENVASLGVRGNEQLSMSTCVAKLLDHLLIFCIVNERFSVSDSSNPTGRCGGSRVVIYNGHTIDDKNFNIILRYLKTMSHDIRLDIINPVYNLSIAKKSKTGIAKKSKT